MPIHSFMQAFDLVAVAAMSEAFDAACNAIQHTNQPGGTREIIAGRIIAAARLGERDLARLLEAAVATRESSETSSLPSRMPGYE